MRRHRDWQFFNRQPPGSRRLMQACFDGLRWSFGFGVNPTRLWLSRLGNNGKFDLHLHCYLPFARWDKIYLGFMATIGWRRRGVWRQTKWPRRTS